MRSPGSPGRRGTRLLQRGSAAGRRTRRIPLRSRVTVRRAVAALRSSREGLVALQAQLDELLRAMRSGGPIAADAPDRLRAATGATGVAVEALGGLRPLLRRSR